MRPAPAATVACGGRSVCGVRCRLLGVTRGLGVYAAPETTHQGERAASTVSWMWEVIEVEEGLILSSSLFPRKNKAV